MPIQDHAGAEFIGGGLTNMAKSTEQQRSARIRKAIGGYIVEKAHSGDRDEYVFVSFTEASQFMYDWLNPELAAEVRHGKR